jgi:toxin ParE1/3/4
MNIRWTPEAADTLEQISRHIAKDNPAAALKTVRTIFESIEQLMTFPHRGRPGREEGTRELVLSPLPYIAAYRVRKSIIEVLYIWHGAQRRR